MVDIAKLPGDVADGVEPVQFAVDFTRAMRKQKTAKWIPSLRTSLAIPRFLFARWCRTQEIAANDYLDAAVLCTPPQDQDLAKAVARALLFPEKEEKKVAELAVAEAKEAVGGEPDDPMADILGDLASLELGIDGMDDLSDLDALLAMDDEDGTENADPDAFELFEELYSSADPAERALGELIHAFGGPAELEANGFRTASLAKVYVARQLLATVGELTPELVAWGVAAGYDGELGKACTLSWELAGVLAGTGNTDLEDHLSELVLQGTGRELGRTIAFLAPYPDVAERRQTFADDCIAKALDLNEFAELIVGLGEWIDPPDNLCETSMAQAPRRTLEAAKWLEAMFGIDLRPDLFVRWFATQDEAHMGTLSVVVADCSAWEDALEDAWPAEARKLEDASNHMGDTLPNVFNEATRLATALLETELPKGEEIACRLASEALAQCPAEEHFLPLLDDFLERGAPPDDLERVVIRADELGVPQEEVYDRLGQALEQLRMMVQGDMHDADRYQRLVARISGIPRDMMEQLAQRAADTNNYEAMAALLAVDMGAAAEALPAQVVPDALGYKGIGGGRNLLTQWFTHRRRLPSAIKQQIKDQAKAALLDEAFDWMGKGEGSGERGLIPQNQSRPFSAGDGLDVLDLDMTLESIVASGKQLDMVTEEDLFANERSRGKAAMGVLVDISGSMSGGELAVCSMAIVMLLGKLLPQEVALAAFESNTHVIKNFTDTTNLDQVADVVLDLEATGGMRVSASGTDSNWSRTQPRAASMRVPPVASRSSTTSA
ncbi:MAG: hypothetical protein AAFS10_08640, partial [Myxococcota bacterium]